MPTVRIPKPLRKITESERLVSVEGSTAGDALNNLLQRYPDLRSHLYDDQNKFITSTDESINVLLGKYDIRELDGPNTALSESDQLTILRTWPSATTGKA